MKRTDIHRPSAINPEDYEFIGSYYLGEPADPFFEMENADRRREVADTIRAMGATWSTHEHGGTCHICGAHAMYIAVFVHVPTNVVIRTGFDCAENMHIGDARAFRGLRDLCKAARERVAKLAAAREFIRAKGIPCMECLASSKPTQYSKPHEILADMWRRLREWSNLSEKQVDFAKKLIDQIKNPQPVEERPAPTEKAPEGRVEITGEIVCIKTVEGDYGDAVKMLVVSDRGGWKVWSTLPLAIGNAHKGSKISFTATLKRSDRDEFFAFAKRPTKAQIIEAQ